MSAQGPHVQAAVAEERLQRFEWERMNLPDLSGKTAIVTGGNAGLGYACSLALASKNANVIIATRDDGKGRKAAEEVNDSVGRKDAATFMHLDLANFSSVASFAEEFKKAGKPLQILLNNAGVMMPKYAQGNKTPEGFEVTLGINYFGPMYLTHLLLDLLKQSAPSRIVNVGSPAEFIGEVPWDDLKGERKTESDIKVYGTTKLLDIMAARELNKRLAGSGVEAFSAHPGVTSTPLYGKTDHSKPAALALEAAQRIAGQSEERGASPILYACASPDVAGKGGAFIGGPVGGAAFFSNLDQFKERVAGSPEASDDGDCARLYDETMAIINQVAPRQVQVLPAV